MSYDYTTERPYVFTEAGVQKLFFVRDFAQRALKLSGAVRAQEMMSAAGSGGSWEIMSLIDYLVERGELMQVYASPFAWQHRVYVSGKEL